MRPCTGHSQRALPGSRKVSLQGPGRRQRAAVGANSGLCKYPHFPQSPKDQAVFWVIGFLGAFASVQVEPSSFLDPFAGLHAYTHLSHQLQNHFASKELNIKFIGSTNAISKIHGSRHKETYFLKETFPPFLKHLFRSTVSHSSTQYTDMSP